MVNAMYQLGKAAGTGYLVKHKLRGCHEGRMGLEFNSADFE